MVLMLYNPNCRNKIISDCHKINDIRTQFFDSCVSQTYLQPDNINMLHVKIYGFWVSSVIRWWFNWFGWYKSDTINLRYLTGSFHPQLTSANESYAKRMRENYTLWGPKKFDWSVLRFTVLSRISFIIFCYINHFLRSIISNAA